MWCCCAMKAAQLTLERIFQTLRCWTRSFFCFELNHSEFPIQKEGQSRGAESPERGFLRGRQIAFMICDYFRVTGAHDTVLDYADLFSVCHHDDNVQESVEKADTGEDERVVAKSVDRTHTHTSVQYILFTSAERTSHALLKGQHGSRIALSSLVIWCVSSLTVCCSLTCRLPRAHHLLHSLFRLPRHQNTQHNRYNKNNSENTKYITHVSKLSQSTSSAIKNHSGVKTCRVAETRARQLPQVMCPKSLRLSQGWKLVLEIHINCFMCRKSWRRRSPSSDHRRTEGIWRNWDSRHTGF